MYAYLISLVVEVRYTVYKNHEVQRDSPMEVVIGFQISLGNAGLGEGKLISF